MLTRQVEYISRFTKNKKLCKKKRKKKEKGKKKNETTQEIKKICVRFSSLLVWFCYFFSNFSKLLACFRIILVFFLFTYFQAFIFGFVIFLLTFLKFSSIFQLHKFHFLSFFCKFPPQFGWTLYLYFLCFILSFVLFCVAFVLNSSFPFSSEQQLEKNICI